MSNTGDRPTDDDRREIADTFGQELDPLKEYELGFNQLEINPFKVFREDVLENRDLARRSWKEHERVHRQWREYMTREGRHPACPNEEHVISFAQYEIEEKENQGDTVKEKLRKLNEVYEYWQDDRAYPHPTDYDPFSLARKKVNFPSSETKDPPHIPLAKLRKKVQAVIHIRDRAIVVLQLKTGMRAGELCNIKLCDISITNDELNQRYDVIGTHKELKDRENVLYIPHTRDGTKSQRPRLLPLDDESRRVLLRYLLIRPDVDQPWLFLSKTGHEALDNHAVTDVWKDAFHPEYAETEKYDSVTSHYARHRFTTYWEVDQEINRELLKYMRGDTNGSKDFEERGGIDEYIHTYYEDIEELYRENIYKLNV